jgi:hypothetical protein
VWPCISQLLPAICLEARIADYTRTGFDDPTYVTRKVKVRIVKIARDRIRNVFKGCRTMHGRMGKHTSVRYMID